jgi:hypothetical protein
MGASIQREDVSRFSKQESMSLLADGTGGRICVNDNDLSDCVKKAIDDGSSYYEIAYYPDSTNWNGEFHKVVVKTSQSNVKLAYRTGYFAPADFSRAKEKEKDEAKLADREMRQAACSDLLTATALLVVAKAIPADQPAQAKYFLAIDPKELTFAPADGGGRNLRMDVGICTFGSKGKALQYFSDHSEQKLAEKEYASMASHAVPHVIQFAPAPDIARVRLVVRDSGSGQMGSVDIPYTSVAAQPPAPKPDANSPPPKP